MYFGTIFLIELINIRIKPVHTDKIRFQFFHSHFLCSLNASLKIFGCGNFQVLYFMAFYSTNCTSKIGTRSFKPRLSANFFRPFAFIIYFWPFASKVRGRSFKTIQNTVACEFLKLSLAVWLRQLYCGLEYLLQKYKIVYRLIQWRHNRRSFTFLMISKVDSEYFQNLWPLNSPRTGSDIFDPFSVIFIGDFKYLI